MPVVNTILSYQNSIISQFDHISTIPCQEHNKNNEKEKNIFGYNANFKAVAKRCSVKFLKTPFL